MKTRLLVFIAVLLSQFCSGQVKLELRIDSLFKSYLDSGLAGSLIVVNDRKITLHEAYGYANNSTKVLNTTSTLFNTASIGKQFTMLSILQLEEKGLLQTSDHLAKFIGSFNDIRDSITLHHLLCHNSGFVKGGTPLNYNSRDSFILSVKSAEPEAEAGKIHRYSNAGYNMLAAVVEIVSGMPLEKYMRKNIFKPLGMKHTSFPWESHTNKKLLATGYNSKREAMPVQHDVWGTRGPGHLVTSMEDLYKWVKGYDNRKFMSLAIKNKIFEDYVPGHETYTWNKAVTKRKTRFYHKGGGRPDFESRMLWYPDDEVLIIFSLNNDYNLARHLFNRIREIMD